MVAVVLKACLFKEQIISDCLILAQLHFSEQKKWVLLSPSIHGVPKRSVKFFHYSVIYTCPIML